MGPLGFIGHIRGRGPLVRAHSKGTDHVSTLGEFWTIHSRCRSFVERLNAALLVPDRLNVRKKVGV